MYTCSHCSQEFAPDDVVDVEGRVVCRACHDIELRREAEAEYAAARAAAAESVGEPSADEQPAYANTTLLTCELCGRSTLPHLASKNDGHVVCYHCRPSATSARMRALRQQREQRNQGAAIITLALLCAGIGASYYWFIWRPANPPKAPIAYTASQPTRVEEPVRVAPPVRAGGSENTIFDFNPATRPAPQAALDKPPAITRQPVAVPASTPVDPPPILPPPQEVAIVKPPVVEKVTPEPVTPRPQIGAVPEELSIFGGPKPAEARASTDAPRAVLPPVERVAAPDAASLAKAEAHIRSTYRTQFNLKTAVARKLFAEQLHQAGVQANDDPATRYALFREARDQYAQAGELAAALSVVDDLGHFFTIDLGEAKTAFLGKTLSTSSIEAAGGIASVSLDLAEQLATQRQFDVASRAAQIATAAATKARNASLAAKAQARMKEFNSMK